MKALEIFLILYIALTIAALCYMAYRISKEIREYWEDYPYRKDPFNE